MDPPADMLAVGERDVKEVEPERNTALRGPIGLEACWWVLWRVGEGLDWDIRITPDPESSQPLLPPSPAPGARSLL